MEEPEQGRPARHGGAGASPTPLPPPLRRASQAADDGPCSGAPAPVLLIRWLSLSLPLSLVQRHAEQSQSGGRIDLTCYRIELLRRPRALRRRARFRSATGEKKRGAPRSGSAEA
ncbi:unnamed protein product [Urochloa humidicola]